MNKWLLLCAGLLVTCATSVPASEPYDNVIIGVDRFIVGTDSIDVTKAYLSLFGVDLLAGSERSAEKVEHLSVKVGESFTVADRSNIHKTYTLSEIADGVAVLQEAWWVAFNRDDRRTEPARTRRLRTYGANMPTVEERVKVVAMNREIEAHPLTEVTSENGRWLRNMGSGILGVVSCTELVVEKGDYSYLHAIEIMERMSYAEMAFAVEHPDNAKNALAIHTAGVDSVLRYYKALVKATPDAKSPVLERLVAKQARGELAPYVADGTKRCR